MVFNKPKIFEQFPNVYFAFSLKSDHQKDDTFYFNMSKSIGDNEEKVLGNRSQLFNKLRLNVDEVIVQKQTHSDIINVVEKFEDDLEGDALITKTNNLGLAISTADCTNIYLYDAKQKIIAAVHSGWMGTEKRILEKTVKRLLELGSNTQNIYAYFGPSICQKNYEVGSEFLDKFEKKYLLPKDGKYLLDLKFANESMLLNYGVPPEQIEISDICSYNNPNYHSYRRDENRSGRALGVIALRDNNEF